MRKVVSNLKFNDKNQLVCKGRNGKYCPVFKKQGSLDGACATYSVIMNLLILGVISDSDTKICVEHKNREVKKLFKVFCNDYGMHRNGQTFYKIKKMLLESFGDVINVKHTNVNSNSWDVIDNVINVLIEVDPVIISVSNSSLSHAMLAVGFEKENGEISKLLCLDPDGDYIHGRKRWNASIDIKKGRKNPFIYLSNLEGIKSKYYVELDDILILSVK